VGIVIPLVTSQKKKSKERDALHVYIVQGFQLTFSPNVTLYYFSSYDVINLLCFCQKTMHGALLCREDPLQYCSLLLSHWRVGPAPHVSEGAVLQRSCFPFVKVGFQYRWILSGISLAWRSSWSGLHSSYAVSSFQFTFYFHLTLYAHQVMMSPLYLCPCQDNGRLWKSSFTILGNTSQCFPTPMQNNYFGWFNSSKGSMSPLDPLGLHHFCRFFWTKKRLIII